MILEQDWQEFFDFLKLRWITFNPNKTLKVYGVQDKSLMSFQQTTAQNKYNISNIPSEDKRLRDQEVLGQQEYEALKAGKDIDSIE